MIKIMKHDFYRLMHGKLFYAVIGISMLTAIFLSLVLQADVRIGISIFGNLTAFKRMEDLMTIATQYYKGLGFLVAAVISVFIGQEYLWKTLCNRWNLTKNRTKMYLSKLLLSCVVSVTIYISFGAMALLFSGELTAFLTSQYLFMMVCGIFPYLALGSVFTFISTVVKNNVYAVIACFAYVLLSELFVSLALNAANALPFLETVIRHTVYGMSQSVNAAITLSEALSLSINAFVITLLTSSIGFIVFKNQEI